MHAAVVTAFDTPPRYQEFPDPVASQPGETVVDVVAAASTGAFAPQADGSHYTSTDRLPLVPGIDAVSPATPTVACTMRCPVTRTSAPWPSGP